MDDLISSINNLNINHFMYAKQTSFYCNENCIVNLYINNTTNDTETSLNLINKLIITIRRYNINTNYVIHIGSYMITLQFDYFDENVYFLNKNIKKSVLIK